MLLAIAVIASAPVFADLETIRQAALRGDVQKQVELAALYQYGFGLQKNRIPALAWYMIAADRGDPVAIQRRDALKAAMAPAAVEAAMREHAALRQQMTALSASPSPNPVPPAPETPPAP